MILRHHIAYSQNHAPLLPLVDILFASVGVFLILMATISFLKQRKTLSQVQADAIIICYPKSVFKLFDPSVPFGRELNPDNISTDILDIVLERKRNFHILAAFGSDAFNERETLEKVFNSVWNRLRDKRRKGVTAGLEVMWFPLGAKGISDLRIIEIWQKNEKRISNTR